MYKVFVNEKKLSINKSPNDLIKNLKYDGLATLEIAVDLLENTSTPEINIFDEDPEKVWTDFNQLYKIIEASGGVVFNVKKEILYIFRLSKWDLPKGKIEPNESLEVAAVREVNEETGLKNLNIKRFINSTYHLYTEKNGDKILKKVHWFLMDYTGDKEPKPQKEEGIKKAVWMPKEEAEKVVFPNTFQNIKLILKEVWETT